MHIDIVIDKLSNFIPLLLCACMCYCENKKTSVFSIVQWVVYAKISKLVYQYCALACSSISVCLRTCKMGSVLVFPRADVPPNQCLPLPQRGFRRGGRGGGSLASLCSTVPMFPWRVSMFPRPYVLPTASVNGLSVDGTSKRRNIRTREHWNGRTSARGNRGPAKFNNM